MNDFISTQYGQIHKNFQYSILAEICVKNNGIQTGPFGSLLHQEDYVDVGTPIITVEHLGEYGIIHSNLPKVSDEDKARLKKFELKVGDIVFSRVGSVDRNSLVNEAENGWLFSGRCLRVRPNLKLLNSRYLSYFLSLIAFKHYISRMAVGGTMPSLNTEILSRVPIYFPPLAEQCRIAEILGAWDEAITLTERLIAAKQRRKQGLMQRLLTGQVRFGEFAKSKGYRTAFNTEVPLDWLVMEFGEFVSRDKRKFDPKKETKSLPCIELEYISQGTGQILGSISTEAQSSVKNRFNAGQVLFGKLRPYLRKFAKPGFDGACSSEIWVLTGKKKLCDNELLFYLIQSDRFMSAATVTSGTKMPRSDWSYLSEIAFAIPSLPEQRRIAAVLQACDAEIALLGQKLVALRRQKQGLMQQLLTGRVRVG